MGVLGHAGAARQLHDRGGVVISIEINGDDGKAIIDRLMETHQEIWYFGAHGMRHVMDAWQKNDMHRKRDFTQQRGRRRVFTVIRPHSWWEIKREERLDLRRARRHQPVRIYSTRPILRQVLYDQLVDEMTDAMREAIHW